MGVLCALDSMPVWKRPVEAIMPGSELQWGRISSALNQRAAPTRPPISSTTGSSPLAFPSPSLPVQPSCRCVKLSNASYCMCYHKLWVHPQVLIPVLIPVLACPACFLYCSFGSHNFFTFDLQNRVRAVKKHHHQNLILYRTRNSRNVRRLWCIYSLLCILVNWLNVCFDFCTRKKKQICITYFYVIFIWSINMFLSYFKLNFCQPVAFLRFNCVSGKLLTKREICQHVMYCHVKSLIIINHYWATMLINRYV